MMNSRFEDWNSPDPWGAWLELEAASAPSLALTASRASTTFFFPEGPGFGLA